MAIVLSTFAQPTPHINKVEAYQAPKKAEIKLAVAEKPKELTPPKPVPAQAETPAPIAVQIPPPAPQPVAPPVIQVAQNGCGDNFYANYIYSHESGCRTTAVNSIGCRGLGQACPGSKLPCGDDYACQNAYFSNYAISRYGSWANAYAFWTANHWW